MSRRDATTECFVASDERDIYTPICESVSRPPYKLELFSMFALCVLRHCVLLSVLHLVIAQDCWIEVCNPISVFPIHLACRADISSTRKWDVGEATNAESMKGCCTTKENAAKVQYGIESKGTVADFILVPDIVFCEPKGEPKYSLSTLDIPALDCS